VGSLLFNLRIGELHLLGIEAVIVVVVGLKLAELELQLMFLVLIVGGGGSVDIGSQVSLRLIKQVDK
jgi:hypothetical protein